MEIENKNEYPDRNNTDFPLALKSNLTALTYDKDEFLRYYQYVVHQYVAQQPDARGLLLLLKMGYGKSILAAALSRLWTKWDPTRKIIVLLAKSLEDNFKKNIAVYLETVEGMSKETIDEEIASKYKFVSYNASNMYEQMTRTNKTYNQLVLEKKLGHLSTLVQQDVKFLENSALIIDEAHNFFNSITNGSQNALNLYDTIMKTSDIKLLFLTGTPVVNHPFELAPCFNMLAGPIRIKSHTTTLFPEERDKFIAHFIDEETGKIKNADRFQNRVVGLLSYYGDFYFDDDQKDFPKIIGPHIVKVPMSPEQFTEYDRAREDERAESTFGKKAEGRFAKGSMSSSYRIKSRQLSNFMMPEHALGPIRGKKARTPFVNKLTKKDLGSDLSKYSPKMAKLMSNVMKNNGPGLIYTEFVTRDQSIIKRLLNMRGFSEFDGGDDGFGIKKAKGKKYAAITGQVPVNERTSILDAYNIGKIAILLISKAGSEGLNLMGTRHVHIFEPYWNLARVDQVKYRAVRYKSHSHLAKKEQNVTVYIYLSDHPEGFDPDEKKEETTDVELYENSVNGDHLNQSFIHALAEASLDCHVHQEQSKGKVKCLMCNPNNKPIYNPVIENEMITSNPCEKMEESQIKAKEIVFKSTGEKFYYTVNMKGPVPRITIYMYNKQVRGHTLMPANHPYYGTLYQAVLNTC